MNIDTIFSELKQHFNDYILATDSTPDIPTVTIVAEAITEVLQYLKDQQGFTVLTDLCGIHYPNQEKELGVIYHLNNLSEKQRIRIKAFVTKENPQISSIVPLYLAANWMERETYDFYGIQFVGHPNLKRILNVEFMDYFPMRKEYPLEDATRTDKDDRFFGR